MKEGEYLDAKCLRQRDGERVSHNEGYIKKERYRSQRLCMTW